MSTARRQPMAHLQEEELQALAGEGAVSPAARAHVAQCAACRQRVNEVRVLRRLLQVAAAQETAPRRDLAGRALMHLRKRHTALRDLNEVLAGLGTLLRGLTTLMPGPRREETGRQSDNAASGHTRG